MITLGYTSPEEAISGIIADEELRKIILENESLIKEETELNTTLKQLDIEINDLKDIVIEDGQIAKLKLDIETLNKEKNLMHQGVGAIQNELNYQAQLKVQFESLKEVILKIETENKPLFHLNILIGDATGTKYAKFAQNLNLKHLIALANGRLTKLTDRYLLADTDIEDDLTVTDLYQGNTKRSVKTLSGGETFIVSLAMALSLADMASQNVKLDSLFIDEGFGTLDQDTMEVALITLEKLQSEGNRTIGIISHVESLKERINTQIKVHKDSQGYSKMEIVQV
jgi:exonuclease SbcC